VHAGASRTALEASPFAVLASGPDPSLLHGVAYMHIPVQADLDSEHDWVAEKPNILRSFVGVAAFA
jgi:hypothetical protein